MDYDFAEIKQKYCDPEQVFTISQCQKIMGGSNRDYRNYIALHELPYRKINGIVHFGLDTFQKLFAWRESRAIPSDWVSVSGVWKEYFCDDMTYSVFHSAIKKLGFEFKLKGTKKFVSPATEMAIIRTVSDYECRPKKVEHQEIKNLEALKKEKPWITDDRCFDINYWPVEPKEWEFEFFKPAERLTVGSNANK